ncbi:MULTISPECIES: hypothetical protein [Klebsiella]|uniref:Uncharacterized protein n=1 Tax=Klebsiella pasteurii TaxID=2587529 RepID=A0A9Q9SB16_9ENTR|nr:MULTISPECIES: hypothetical protein [Klebsiella]EHT14312.1 hypothetical protein HMPREF9694_00316 [Klebsiella michiganensis]MBF8459738.1 hypothetical protein [Klebsiella michiganensis]MCW9583547.1 hypothetical protein [Klebsiella pasteurii]MDR6614624.1 hypothetical protein [Klebsiella sp. 1400]MDV1072193.1 hypothetical protein [Klebsiella pasteurii]
MNKKKLEIFFSSPIEYEELTLEIQLDRERIVEINQDHGLDNLEVELFGSDKKYGFVAKMPLDDLINILIEARDTLKKTK